MNSAFLEPLNLGSAELVTINEVVDVVEEIAGVRLERRYDLEAPKGVRGRNSDNSLIRKMLAWEPSVPLRRGLEQTYGWIYDEIVGAPARNNGVTPERLDGSRSKGEGQSRDIFEKSLIAQPARRSQVTE
jgi:hypothetical protein